MAKAAGGGAKRTVVLHSPKESGRNEVYKREQKRGDGYIKTQIINIVIISYEFYHLKDVKMLFVNAVL